MEGSAFTGRLSESCTQDELLKQFIGWEDEVQQMLKVFLRKMSFPKGMLMSFCYKVCQGADEMDCMHGQRASYLSA